MDIQSFLRIYCRILLTYQNHVILFIAIIANPIIFILQNDVAIPVHQAPFAKSVFIKWYTESFVFQLFVIRIFNQDFCFH